MPDVCRWSYHFSEFGFAKSRGLDKRRDDQETRRQEKRELRGPTEAVYAGHLGRFQDHNERLRFIVEGGT